MYRFTYLLQNNPMLKFPQEDAVVSRIKEAKKLYPKTYVNVLLSEDIQIIPDESFVRVIYTPPAKLMTLNVPKQLLEN